MKKNLTTGRDGLISQDEVSTWLGLTGAWMRLIRNGRIACPVPMPKPDVVVRQSNRAIPYWDRDRLGEFEQWYRAHIQAIADEKIAAMEANITRLRRERLAAAEAEVVRLRQAAVQS